MIPQTIEITFLGTGTSTGVPLIGCGCEVCKSPDPRDKRLRSSIMVRSATTTFVVDTTPDFRYQMLRTENTKLDAVLFTHPHKDHIGGLDDVRPFNFFQERSIKVYANELTVTNLKREYYYAFDNTKIAGLPEIELHVIDHVSPFLIGDIPVTPLLVWHNKMPVQAYRFGNFTYITDGKTVEPEELRKTFGSDTLVINALRREAHHSHFTLSEAIEVANKVGARQTYFTHLGHQMGRYEHISKELPPGMAFAYDGLRLQAIV